MTRVVHEYLDYFLKRLKDRGIRTQVIIDLPNVLLYNTQNMLRRIALLISFLEALHEFGFRISVVYNSEGGVFGRRRFLRKVVLSLLRYASNELRLDLQDTAEKNMDPDRRILEIVDDCIRRGIFPLVVSMDRKLNNYKDLLISEDREREKRRFAYLERVKDIDFHRIVIYGDRSGPQFFSTDLKILAVLFKNTDPPETWPESLVPEEPIEMPPPDVMRRFRLVVIERNRPIDVAPFYFRVIRSFVELRMFLKYIGFPEALIPNLKVFVRRPVTSRKQLEERVQRVLREGLVYRDVEELDISKILHRIRGDTRNILAKRYMVYIPVLVAVSGSGDRYFLINTRFGIRQLQMSLENYINEFDYVDLKAEPLLITGGLEILLPKQRYSFNGIFDKKSLSTWFTKHTGSPEYMILPLILLEPHLYIPGIRIKDKIFTLTIDAAMVCEDIPRIYVDVESEFKRFYLYKCKECQRYVFRTDIVRVNEEVYCRRCHSRIHEQEIKE